MRALAGLLAAANALVGLRALLQAVGVLRNAKYATGTTAAFAAIFLALGTWGLYAAASGAATPRTALWLGLAPWALGGVVLFLQLALGNPQ